MKEITKDEGDSMTGEIASMEDERQARETAWKETTYSILSISGIMASPLIMAQSKTFFLQNINI
jgi:hypothetical protein